MIDNVVRFVKGLLRPEPEEIAVEEVQAKALDAWIDAKAKALLSSAEQRIKSVNSDIAAEIAGCREKLKSLENAELRNPNISAREKSFMVGNRANYVRHVSLFLDRIVLCGSASAAREFVAAVNRDADSLAKSTLRSFHVLQEFFAHESRDVSSAIKRITELSGSLGRDEASLAAVSELRQLVSFLDNRRLKKAGIESELDSLREKHNTAGEAFKIANRQIEGLLKSDSYRSFAALKSQLDSLSCSLGALRASIEHDFAVVSRALKKFEKVSFDKAELVKKYLDDPVGALVTDFELKIVDVLKDVEKNIDAIGILDRKREKTLDTIRKMDRDFLGGFLSRYNHAVKEMNSVVVQLRDSGIEEKHSALLQELEMRRRDLSALESRIQQLGNELSRVNIEGIKKELAEKAKTLFNVRLVIT